MNIKFNGGRGALLCDECHIIIAEGNNIPNEVKCNHIQNLYFFCSDECKAKYLEKFEKRCRIINKI